MRSEIEEPGIPSGIALTGSEDEAASFTMLYFDERAVARRRHVGSGHGVELYTNEVSAARVLFRDGAVKPSSPAVRAPILIAHIAPTPTRSACR